MNVGRFVLIIFKFGGFWNIFRGFEKIISLVF